eukprot:SAG11_NODE_1207_length_5524_cov_2.959447_7_plen_85_part_00
MLNINTSYSKIADVSAKLKLEDPADAEYIVAKAIRDGVIDATIDHGAASLRRYCHSCVTHALSDTDIPHHRCDREPKNDSITTA